MTPQQAAKLYDSFPPEKQDMGREQFVKTVTGILDPQANTQILDHMVRRKRQTTCGRIERARIDAALRDKG